jgi:hypothetical protein
MSTWELEPRDRCFRFTITAVVEGLTGLPPTEKEDLSRLRPLVKPSLLIYSSSQGVTLGFVSGGFHLLDA